MSFCFLQESVIAKLKEKLGNENEKRELERETFQNEVCVAVALQSWQLKCS